MINAVDAIIPKVRPVTVCTLAEMIHNSQLIPVLHNGVYIRLLIPRMLTPGQKQVWVHVYREL